MGMQPNDLTSLKDDMIAFIEGHGLKRFRGYVSEDVTSVMWDAGDDPDSWKDFVELAKASGASFLTMNDFVLRQEDVDFLITRLRDGMFSNPEDVEEARWLRTYLGQTGFVQVGWPYQGILFLHEVASEWYDRYQRLFDLAEECGGIMFDGAGQDDDH
jgi:hypothetical protein